MEKQTLVTTTKQEYLATFSPKNLQTQYRGVTTVAQAMQAGSSSLATLKRAYSPKQVEALIKLQLIELNEMLNLKRPLSEAQIDNIADEIVSTYYHLTMADVYLIFRRAKTGHYGEFYESINMPKVLTWFRDYFDERCNEAERQSIENAEINKYYSNAERVSTQTQKANSTYQAQKLIHTALKG